MESFWSTSVMKKKKFRFGVELKVVNLSNFALAKGILFAKARLVERANGDFEANTSRVNATNHCALWDQEFEFSCRMYAKPQVGVLEECMLRVSVRKETKSGKADKLGYVQLNLAEFAGVGTKERRCLLQSYDTNNYKGHDNSILLVSLSVTLQHGDPVYQRPESTSPSRSTDDPELDELAYAGSGRSSACQSATSSPVTPRRPPALFQSFLARRNNIMASLRSSAGTSQGDAIPATLSAEQESQPDPESAERVSIGSNDLSPEALDVESTLVAGASCATILSPSQATLTGCDESRAHPILVASSSLASSHTSFPPASTVSLDSAFESNCSSSTGFQRSENDDHLSLSLSSTANSSSLRVSFQDLSVVECTDKDDEKVARSKYLPVESSQSGSTSAPATVRQRKSTPGDARTLDDVRFHSLETTSRLNRMQKAAAAATASGAMSASSRSHMGTASHNPSLKSSGRVSSASSSTRASEASIKFNVESTRIDASELIDSLITRSREDISEGPETSPNGLQLYIGADGSTAVGGKAQDRPMSAAHYRKVVVDHK